MKLIQREYASGAGSSEATQKACETDHPHVSMAPLITSGTVSESKQGAECVEDWSSVQRSGAVKTTRVSNCGNQTVLEMTEKFGNSSGQVGKMKVADVPQNSCKQTTRNSFELAASRRHLTANVENKWLSYLHESVNSANFHNANTFSGTLPEPRKRNLPLPKLLMHFVHKWLLTFSVTWIWLRMCRHTPICSLKPLLAPITLRSTLRDSMNLRSTLLDSISLVPPGGALCRQLVDTGNLGHK